MNFEEEKKWLENNLRRRDEGDRINIRKRITSERKKVMREIWVEDTLRMGEKCYIYVKCYI